MEIQETQEKTLSNLMGFDTQESEDESQNFVLGLISEGNSRSEVLRKIIKNLSYTHDQRAYLCYYYGAVEIMAAQQKLHEEEDARKEILKPGRSKMVMLS